MDEINKQRFVSQLLNMRHHLIVQAKAFSYYDDNDFRVVIDSLINHISNLADDDIDFDKIYILSD